MKINTVKSSWISNTLRLDSGPYASGAFRSQFLLDNLDVNKKNLQELTKGYNGGIYNGPQFTRSYVNDPTYGVPFISSGSMMQVNFTKIKYLRRGDAVSKRLSYLKIERGMTLISCSGTIGRMVYAGPDIDGFWSSQDILKVNPDANKVLPGYLYAYLSSQIAHPIITSGTYGAIIQHLEPQHIDKLTVPLFNYNIQHEVHQLIERASVLRCESNHILNSAIVEYERYFNLPDLDHHHELELDVNLSFANSLNVRMDAKYHSDYHQTAISALRTISASQLSRLRDYDIRIYEPARFKRVAHVDTEKGMPFFGTTSIFWANPEPNYCLVYDHTIDKYIVNKKMVLIPRSGQSSGIIGNVILPHGSVVNSAVSEDAIRVEAKNENLAGFMFIALSSEYSVRQLKSRIFGSSIPHLDIYMIGEVFIPKPPKDFLSYLGEIGLKIANQRSEAYELERKAKKLIEELISD